MTECFLGMSAKFARTKGERKRQESVLWDKGLRKSMREAKKRLFKERSESKQSLQTHHTKRSEDQHSEAMVRE